MTIVAAADGVRADVLRLAAGGVAPSGWDVRVEATPRGSLLVAGPDTARDGDWLVAGAPTADPWGLPFRARPLADVAALFARYGPAAVQIPAGPFVAVNLADGTAVRALNGIVPLYVPARGPHWVASTSASLVAAVTGAPAISLRPGESARPGRDRRCWSLDLPAEQTPAMRFTWAAAVVAEALREHGVSVGHANHVGDSVYGAAGAYSVFVPGLPRQRALARYGHLRDDVLPRLWWRERQAGRWLCAPLFERPVLDMMVMVGPAGSSRVETVMSA